MFDRPNLRNRAVVIGENQCLAFEDPIKDAFGISLHLFDRNIHSLGSLAKIDPTRAGDRDAYLRQALIQQLTRMTSICLASEADARRTTAAIAGAVSFDARIATPPNATLSCKPPKRG